MKISIRKRTAAIIFHVLIRDLCGKRASGSAGRQGGASRMCRGRSKHSKIPDNSPFSRSQSLNYRKKPAFKVNKNDNGCCHKNRRRVVYHLATKNIKKYQKILSFCVITAVNSRMLYRLSYGGSFSFSLFSPCTFKTAHT